MRPSWPSFLLFHFLKRVNAASQTDREPSLLPLPLLPSLSWSAMDGELDKKHICTVTNKKQFKILVIHRLLIHHLRPPPKMDVEIQMTKKRIPYQRQYALGWCCLCFATEAKYLLNMLGIEGFIRGTRRKCHPLLVLYLTG